MTKHLLSFAAAAAFFMPPALAQQEPGPGALSPFRKGNLTIGTRIGLAELSGGSHHDGSNGIRYNVSLAPAVGYFVSDNWLLLASGNVAASGVNYGVVYSSRSAGIGLGGRYYFGKALNSKSEVNRFRIYAEAGASLQQGWGKIKLSDSLSRRSAAYGIDFRGGAGFNYLINDHLALESGLGYNRNLYNSRNLKYQSNVQLELGIRVFISRKGPFTTPAAGSETD